MIVILVCSIFGCKFNKKDHQLNLNSPNWDPYVKANINLMLTKYGKFSSQYDKNNKPYAVFDFDNTTSIMDFEEALIIYQMTNMRFNIESGLKMKQILQTGLDDKKLDTTLIHDNKETVINNIPITARKVIHDISLEYQYLKDNFDISADVNITTKCIETNQWKDFSTKIRWLYDSISETFDSATAYPWITYLFTGMTETQVQKLALESHIYWIKRGKDKNNWGKKKMAEPSVDYFVSDGDTKNFDPESTDDSDKYLHVPALAASYNDCIAISDEMKELYNVLYQNGIDIWICSASFIDVIKPIAKNSDIFGFKGITNVLGMTNKKDANGKYLNEYDYDLHDQTQGYGKTTTIKKCIMPKYNNKGPILVGLDSQCDYTFATEFKDTAIALILNRIRKDDISRLSSIALYQKITDENFLEAKANNDTMFLLQGRNDNQGVFIPYSDSYVLGENTKIYLSDIGLEYLKELLNETKTITSLINSYPNYLNGSEPGYKLI